MLSTNRIMHLICSSLLPKKIHDWVFLKIKYLIMLRSKFPSKGPPDHFSLYCFSVLLPMRTISRLSTYVRRHVIFNTPFTATLPVLLTFVNSIQKTFVFSSLTFYYTEFKSTMNTHIRCIKETNKIKSHTLYSTGIPRVWMSSKMKFLERHQSEPHVWCHHHFRHWLSCLCIKLGKQEVFAGKGLRQELRAGSLFCAGSMTAPQLTSRLLLPPRGYCFSIALHFTLFYVLTFGSHYYFRVIMPRFSSMCSMGDSKNTHKPKHRVEDFYPNLRKW